MLLHFFLFPLFVFGCVSLGSFFLFINSIILRTKESGTDDLEFFGFIGLFFLGILGVVVNFVLPLSSALFLGIIVSCVVLGSVLLINRDTPIFFKDFELLLLFSLLLAPLSGSMGPGYDAGLYHLPHQLWLRNDSIVTGLANLHGRFGFSSLYEYISAPLWIGESFLLLSYLQASFLVFFFFFLCKQSTRSTLSHYIFILCVIINIIIFNDYYIIKYSYTDMPAGIAFICTLIYGQFLINNDSRVTRYNWTIFSIFFLFALFLKISSVILALWYIFVLLYRIILRKDSLLEMITGQSILAVCLCFYLVKNILSTGCLFYPIADSCIAVPWAAKENALNDAAWITAWARQPQAGLSSLENFNWLFSWWLPHYKIFWLNYLKAGAFIGVMSFSVAYRFRFNCMNMLNIKWLAAVFFIVVSFLFWFYKAPDPRFGIGCLTLLFPILFLFLYTKMEQKYIFHPFLRLIIVVVICVMGGRIGEPWKKLSFSNALMFSSPVVRTPEVKKEQNFGVRPVKGDQCWVVPECAPYDRPVQSSWYGKKVFYSK